MTYTKEQKAAKNREYRARKAIAAGREPGKTGRPKMYGPPKPHHFERSDRSGDYDRQRERRQVKTMYLNGENGEPIDPMTVPVYAQAVEVANKLTKKDRRDNVAEDLWDDILCEAALAICEGVNPYEAAGKFKAYYYKHANIVRSGVPDTEWMGINTLIDNGDASYGASVYKKS